MDKHIVIIPIVEEEKIIELVGGYPLAICVYMTEETRKEIGNLYGQASTLMQMIDQKSSLPIFLSDIPTEEQENFAEQIEEVVRNAFETKDVFVILAENNLADFFAEQFTKRIFGPKIIYQSAPDKPTSIENIHAFGIIDVVGKTRKDTKQTFFTTPLSEVVREARGGPAPTNPDLN